MNASTEVKEYRMDGLKWLVVLVLVAVGVVGNSFYSELAILYRALALVALAGVAIFVAINTEKGAAFWGLLREAQAEFRRVVWPTRQEVNQTTLIVVAVVLVMAVVLWMLDSLLGWLASLIIG